MSLMRLILYNSRRNKRRLNLFNRFTMWYPSRSCQLNNFIVSITVLLNLKKINSWSSSKKILICENLLNHLHWVYPMELILFGKMNWSYLKAMINFGSTMRIIISPKDTSQLTEDIMMSSPLVDKDLSLNLLRLHLQAH